MNSGTGSILTVVSWTGTSGTSAIATAVIMATRIGPRVCGWVRTWSAARWHRLGDVRLAVVLCGVAGLLASPVSWLHHFVWVVPLAVCLLDRAPAVVRTGGGLERSEPRLPIWVRVLGLVFVGWVIVAPFQRLPNGADVELTWTWSQHLLASVTALLGVAFGLPTATAQGLAFGGLVAYFLVVVIVVRTRRR